MRPDMSDMSSDTSYRVTADELRQFIERIERLDAEKKDLAEQQKEVMAEAKGRGYDTKVMRKVIALRKRDQNDIIKIFVCPPMRIDPSLDGRTCTRPCLWIFVPCATM